MPKVTIRTELNNITYLKEDGTFDYDEQFIWSKRHKDECIKSEKNDNHNSILNEPDDACVLHRGDTS